MYAYVQSLGLCAMMITFPLFLSLARELEERVSGLGMSKTEIAFREDMLDWVVWLFTSSMMLHYMHMLLFRSRS
jgi:hypothetical protein